MKNSGILEVHLVNARGLKNNEIFGGGIDPYVLIQYKNQQLKSRVARGQGSKPEWDQKFMFRADYPGVGENDYKLNLKVMDHDTFSRDDYLGESTIYLKDLLAQGVENGTATIQPQKYRVVAADRSYQGEIIVGLTFTRKHNNIEEAIGQDFGGWKQSTY